VIDLGDTYTSSIKVYDKPPEDGGILIDPSTAALTVTLPGGAILAGTTPTKTGTGQYKYDLVTTLPGRTLLSWVTTGPATTYSEVINVTAADPGFIVSLAVAKDHLNKRNSNDDEEIRRLIAATTTQIETRIGPVVRRTVVERVRTGWGSKRFLLGQAPVISLTSMVGVTTGLAAVTVGLLDVDPTTGAVTFLDPWGYFVGGVYTITYVVGRVVIDEGIVSAALSYIRGAWETQRGVALPLQDASDLSSAPGMGAVLQRLELDLRPFLRVPAVA